MPQLWFRREDSSYVFYIEPVATGDDEICADQIPSNARWYVGHSAGSSTSVARTDVTGNVVAGFSTGLVNDDDLQFALSFVSAGRYVSYLQVGDTQGNLYTLTLNPRHEFPINDGVWAEQTLSISPGQDTVQVSSRLDCEEDPPTIRLLTDGRDVSTYEVVAGTRITLSWEVTNGASLTLDLVESATPPTPFGFTSTFSPLLQNPGTYTYQVALTGTNGEVVTDQVVITVTAVSTDSGWSSLARMTPLVEPSTDSDWSGLERMTAFDEPSTDSDWSSLTRMTAFVEPSTDSDWSTLAEMTGFVSACSIDASNTSPSANATVTITATWENSNGAVTVFDNNNAVLHTSTSATGTWSNNYAESGGTQRIFNINCDGQGTIGRPVDDSVTVNWQRRTQPEDFNLICDPIPEITIARQPVPNYVGDYEDLGDFPPGQTGTPYNASIGDVVLYAKQLWRATRNGRLLTPVEGLNRGWDLVTNEIVQRPDIDSYSYNLSSYFRADDSLVDESEIRIFDAPDDDGNDVTFTVFPRVAIAFARAATVSVLALEVGQTNIAFRIFHPDTVSRANCNFNVTITDATLDSEWSSLEEMTPFLEASTDSDWSSLARIIPFLEPSTDSDWSPLVNFPREASTDSDWSSLERMTLNSPPVCATLPDRTVVNGQSVNVDLSAFLSDPDGDSITIEVSENDANISISNLNASRHSFTINGLSVGTATVTVVPIDSLGARGTACEFEVTVRDPATHDCIPLDITRLVGQRYEGVCRRTI